MLNACLSHGWPDKSFQPRSWVAQLRPGTWAVKVRTLEAVRMCGELMAGSSPELPGRLVVSLGVRRWSYPRFGLELYQRWPMWPRWGKYGCVLGIIPQLGRNWFESPSLLDSENLIGVRFIIVIDGSLVMRLWRGSTWYGYYCIHLMVPTCLA